MVWTIEVVSVVILDVSSVVWGGVVYIIVVLIADVRLLLVVTVPVTVAEVVLFVIVLDGKVEAALLSKMVVVESDVK